MIGYAFGSVQLSAARRYEKLQHEGKFKSGWSATPGSFRRVAYLLVALALVQFLFPVFFAPGGISQWCVSGGVVGWIRLDLVQADAHAEDLRRVMRLFSASIGAVTPAGDFPRPLSGYPPLSDGGLLSALSDRARAEPFNLVATAIFFLAIVHTFLTPLIRRWAHRAEERHRIRPRNGRPFLDDDGNEVPEVSFRARFYIS